MTFTRLQLTPHYRRIIAAALETSAQPGVASIRGELAGSVLEVPVPPTIDVAGNAVLAPCRPRERFAILVTALAQSPSPTAWRIIEELVHSSTPADGWEADAVVPVGPSPLAVAFWNVNGGTLDPARAADRDLPGLKCRSISDLLARAGIVGLSELESRTRRCPQRVSVNRAGWQAVASAAGAVLLCHAPGLPATRDCRHVGVLVRADLCDVTSAVGGGVLGDGGEWLALRVGEMVICTMYAQGDAARIADAIDAAEHCAGRRTPVLVGGDLDLRGLPGVDRGDSRYASITELHRLSPYRAVTAGADSDGWKATWRVAHRTGDAVGGARDGAPVQLDHVLVRPDRIDRPSLTVVPALGSDHLPVLTELRTPSDVSGPDREHLAG